MKNHIVFWYFVSKVNVFKNEWLGKLKLLLVLNSLLQVQENFPEFFCARFCKFPITMAAIPKQEELVCVIKL